MASSGLDEAKIEYDDNGPASRHFQLGTKQPSSQLDGTNIESPSDVGSIPLVEFAVNCNDHDDLRKLDEALQRRNVKIVSSNLADKTIHVQFADYRDAKQASLDVQSVQRYVEQETGFLAVIKGMGDLSAAVAELRPAPSSNRSMFGVVRLSQMASGACFVDGLIDESNAPAADFDSLGQPQNRLADDRNQPFRLAIHEFGDLSSDNFDSIGEPAIEIVQKQSNDRPASISVQRIVPQCDVAKLIGKSMALSIVPKPTNASNESGEIFSAGVIARASTISANKKQVCACSGKTLWEERAERQKDR